MISLDFPTWFLALMITPFGLVVGSFANVLIYRLPLEEPADRDVVTKPSHCPSCKAKIKPWHNIPVFGWLLLRGKCAACGWKIPGRYPLVELLGGLIFAASIYVFPVGTLIWAKGLICAFALLVLFFTDYTEFFLPDVIQFPLMALGLLFTLPQLFWPDAAVTIMGSGGHFIRVDLFHNGLQASPLWAQYGEAVTWKASLIGMVAGYGGPALLNAIYKLIRKTDGMGMGDFKMLAWLGAFWGWGPMVGILMAGAILGTFVGTPIIFVRALHRLPRAVAIGQTMGIGKSRLLCARFMLYLHTKMIPFGCFLAVGTFPIIFFGQSILASYWRTFVE